MRDLSTIKISPYIDRNEPPSRALPAINSLLDELTLLIIHQDAEVMKSMSFADASDYVGVETYESLLDLTRQLANRQSEHIAGTNCPICKQMDNIHLVIDTLINRWVGWGQSKKFWNLTAFRYKATDEGRTIN